MGWLGFSEVLRTGGINPMTPELAELLDALAELAVAETLEQESHHDQADDNKVVKLDSRRRKATNPMGLRHE